MAPPVGIRADRRITLTAGAIIALCGTVAGGVGATATFKVLSEAKDKQHDVTDHDHEVRIRRIEDVVMPSLARIEEAIKGIERRIP